MAQLTPMMKQYLDIHNKVKDAILFFRLGDFYEMFFDDALTASRELEITLTGRDCGLDEKAPMCGVPYHAAENYIARLIEKGYKVAICEQVEDPKQTKGIVKREIARIISPGTISDGKMLKNKNNNYLMSIYYNMTGFGLAIVDVSTGEFYTSQVVACKDPKEKLLDEIAKYNPSEIIINTVLFKEKWLIDNIEKRFHCYSNILPNKYFNLERCQEILEDQFKVYSMTSLGLQDDELSIKASGALITYLNETQMRVLTHIDKIKKYLVDDYMAIDISTRRNLELTENMRTSERKGSLLDVLDHTQTSMGGRKMKSWINQPLVDVDQINGRLGAIEAILENMSIQISLGENLKKIYDLERLISKISFGNCNGRDFLSLKYSLDIIPKVKGILLKCNSDYIEKLNNDLDPISEVVQLIEKSIHPETPVSVKDGNLIRDGYNDEVDYYRNITVSGKDLIINLEIQEREKTGIKSLKIKYNKIFGYYIDVTKSNLHSVPNHYIRKQTLANSERYYTDELKDIESKILNAEDKIINLEYEIFQSIRKEVLNYVQRIKQTAENISVIDVLYSFAIVSYKNNYIKPIINSGDEIIISEGRHPVVENMLSEQEFVPNSCELNCVDATMLVITGPNMAGKSTFIRQVAIITLMAQIGCYVPAQEAILGVVDRIFTRVGASDDLALGHSTFMVEMSEVSNILKNATSKSLIILDEIGRGTSTFDGLSIAWSVVEYLHNKEILGAKALFATHYHELTQLENILSGVKNYCIKVQESEEGVIFLRKIIPGSADQSYGIEVAKLAGLPDQVVKRAREILSKLENNEEIVEGYLPKTNLENEINLFNYSDKLIIEELKKLPIDDMTPMEVMNYIYELKKRL
ncbi:DNA mismatch repair protein MutS [Alkalibaculum sp. M08DMB]|uniref:DNA mismatch repair protein MutS n=1 Tax=Alkalibaculum sporogenes TaxID=2655001 RepID=A0A6A7K721_9FIRM|nr:DNA mismatch repair protein MutS [Alkalibaculum sporogenes]MPW25214.1 DNA mismatch repair protein MutS [Alkalibaculum sporogenes]